MRHYGACSILAAGLLLGISSCQQSKQNTNIALPEYQETSAWEAFQDRLSTLPLFIQDQLGPNFYALIEQYASTPEGQKVIASLRVQFAQSPKYLPIFPNFSIPLRHKSIYDNTTIDYIVHAPEHPEKSGAVVIYLGDQDPLLSLAKKQNCWQLSIPSRKNMNYQLLAEGDFWNILEQVTALYPQIQQFRPIIVGQGDAADAALYLANHYPTRFTGVVYSGGKIGFNVPNLDQIPIVYVENDQYPAGSPWGGEQLLERLQNRNNRRAHIEKRGGLFAGIKHLIESNDTEIPGPIQFSDYQYAQIQPWLKVLSKKNESAAVSIKVWFKNEELYVEGQNIRCFQLDCHPSLNFPSNVNRVRFNGELFAFQNHGGRINIGHEDVSSSWQKKAQHPGFFLNFFRNEPLVLLYQDKKHNEEYLKQAKQFANTLSQLNISGLPPVDVQLPLIPLSDYKPEKLGAHRAIIVGHPSAVEPILSKNYDELPIQRTPQKVLINHQAISLPYPNFDRVAYGVIYPPEEDSFLKVALILAAEDTEGLSTLQRYYTSATALYKENDLNLWVRNQNEYVFANDRTFDSFWGNSSIHDAMLAIPEQSHEVWERYLQEILIEESGIPALATSSLVEDYAPVPNQLNLNQLKFMIPEQHFARIKLGRNTGTILGNKLLSATQDLSTYGLADLIDLESPVPQITDGKLKKNQYIVIDANALSTLSDFERGQLQYEILPYSLRELVFQRVQKDPVAVGRELIRLSNVLGEFSTITE
ncbi:MAG: hypothetical protein CMO81_08385 [Waddliaceae bacterium]|nr:hypothetical protein [Waddliaceae bacterium]